MSEHPYVYDQIMQKYDGVAPWDGYTLKKSIHEMSEDELLYHYTDNDFSPSMMGSTYGMYGAGAYDKTVPWQWFAPEDVIVFMYSSEVGGMAGETIRNSAMAIAMQNAIRNDNRPTEAPEPTGANEMSEAAENVGEYLAKKASKQVTAGTTMLEGQYVNDLGVVQPWKAFYDKFGRLIARTDYNAGNAAAGISDTHYHLYEWGPGKTPYEYGSHIGGEYILWD